MKTLIITSARNIMKALFVTWIVQVVAVNVAIAQLPDCVSGTVMYGVFTNVAGSGTADSTEIRPINYATGAVGALMGGKRYWIRHQVGATWYYGSSAMAVDKVTNRFYLNTQMPTSGGSKDLITINPTIPGTMTVIGTMPATLDAYHFVKMAIAPNGYGYAVGVNKDSTAAAGTFNPLIRFSACGTANCATTGPNSIDILGYLPGTGLTYKWLLFNGDLAFDSYGNLFFATAGYGRVNGIGRYTDARLFKINAADIPSTVGAGTIPMALMADYDLLDSTVVNGIALDPAGKMYMSTKRFTGVQTSPAGPSNPELYVSTGPGTAAIIPGFGPITANFSIGDLASCYFPAAVLSTNKLQLSGQYVSGTSHLKWEVTGNSDALYFELQRSEDGNSFETIARISPDNATQSMQKYSYRDLQNDFTGNKFYRIRQVMNNGGGLYSNVVKVSIYSKISLTTRIKPNPFIDHFDFAVQLKSAGIVNLALTDQSGRTINRYKFNCSGGENKLTINDLSDLKEGIYVVELSVDEEVIREKLIKK